MKKIILIYALLLNGGLAFADNKPTAFLPLLTQDDQKEILSIIDHDCADSWCSGDYEYKFSTFSCNENSSVCTLTFKIIDREGKPGESKPRNRRCIFKGIVSRAMLFHESKLNEEFYDQLNYCISNRESK
jgi:hypothetical protein